MTQPNKKPKEPNARVAKFIHNLEALDAGEKARLKRDAGKDISEARSLGLFYRLLPFGTPQWQEKDYFLAATLFPLADPCKSGCLGDALYRARNPDAKQNKGLDRRIEILLDSDDTQLAYRLQQTVRLLKSKGIPVNWPELTEDLLNWNSPYRSVQRRWARAYFKLPTFSDEDTSVLVSNEQPIE
jgi:CRISPR type I-E-associated protein CasB/Cse2